MARELFSLDIDIGKLHWRLDEAKQRHIPFALANALTITAGQAKDALEREIKDVFDRPTPMIQRAPRFTRTTKRGPFYVFVFLSEDRAKGQSPVNILRAHVTGGQRAQKRHEVLLSRKGFFGDMGHGFTRPADRSGTRLNQYGNMSGAKYMQILSRLKAMSEQGSTSNETERSKARNKAKSRASYFVGEGDRFKGVWQRYGSTKGKRGGTILPRKRRPVLIFLEQAKYEERFDVRFVVELTHRKNINRNFGFAFARAIATDNRK